MFADFCAAPNPSRAAPVCLHAVFRLLADESYRVNHEPLPPGRQILILVTAGTGFLGFSGHSRILAAGDVFLFSPGTDPFRYHTLGDTWDFWWFEFSGQPPALPENPLFDGSSIIPALCAACLDALKRPDAQAASGLFAALLAQLSLAGSQGNGSNPQARLFRKALQIIRSELGEVQVSSLAKSLGISQRTLRDLFVARAGCSPKQYILSAKHDSACFLLKNTTKPIGEISDLLGFSSPFHFSRFFREQSGLSPTEWRKNPALAPSQSQEESIL